MGENKNSSQNMLNPPIEYIYPLVPFGCLVVLWILRNAPAVQFEQMKPNGFILKSKAQIGSSRILH